MSALDRKFDELMGAIQVMMPSPPAGAEPRAIVIKMSTEKTTVFMIEPDGPPLVYSDSITAAINHARAAEGIGPITGEEIGEVGT